jgi:hypothetical protein
MKRFRLPAGLVWFCLPACGLPATGCSPAGPPTYKVTGQVLLDGKPLTVQPQIGRVMIKFIPAAADPSQLVDPKFAVYDEGTGRFFVPGADGKGVAAGKYRIAVYQYDPFPQTDKLNGVFKDGKTPLAVDITGALDMPPTELRTYMK